MLKSVLLADDDAPLIRRLIRSTLGSKEYECVNANNGREALKLLFTQEFDLIISDLNMPGLNGLELLEQIRAQIPKLKTPILMLTSDSQLEHVKLAKHYGISGWIIKPSTPDVLLKAVNRLLNTGQ